MKSLVRWFTPLVAIVALAFLIGACGDDDDADVSGGATTAPATATSKPSGGTPTAEPQTLRIGMAEDLTGANASNTAAGVQGAQLAVAEINDAGGIVVDGVPYVLELVQRDLRSDQTAAIAACEELVNDLGVQLVLGPQLETGLSCLTVTQEAGIPHFLAPTAAEKELDNPDNCCLFRETISSKFRDPVWFGAVAQLLPEAGSIGFILPNNASGHAVYTSWGPAAAAVGMTDLGAQFYEPGVTDFSAILTAFAGDNPDVLFTSFIANDIPAIIRQAIELGIGKGFAFGGGTADIAEKNLGSPIDQPYVSLFTGAQFFNPSTQAVSDFVDHYNAFLTETGQEKPTLPEIALYHYDFIYWWVKAIETLGCYDCYQQITDFIEGDPFTGVRGTLDFDETHRVKYDVDACLNQSGDIECHTYKVE